jgi:hypothetical protein
MMRWRAEPAGHVRLNDLHDVAHEETALGAGRRERRFLVATPHHDVGSRLTNLFTVDDLLVPGEAAHLRACAPKGIANGEPDRVAQAPAFAR